MSHVENVIVLPRDLPSLLQLALQPGKITFQFREGKSPAKIVKLAAGNEHPGAVPQGAVEIHLIPLSQIAKKCRAFFRVLRVVGIGGLGRAILRRKLQKGIVRGRFVPVAGGVTC